jgi:hypothetical protein
MSKKITLGLLITLLSFFTAEAQDNIITHSFYFIGNTTDFPQDKNWQTFRSFVRLTKENFTLIHLGDLANNKNKDVHATSIEKMARVLEGIPNGKIYFTPGDKDWENSKKSGFESVLKLEKEIEKLLPGSFIPSSACPGPKVIDIAPDIRLVALNSQWWMHPYDKPSTVDTECKCHTEQEFIDNLDEVVRESEGKNIIIVGHHPVISQGNYGGHIPLKRHLFPFPDNYIPAPVFGSIYAAFRQNSGTVRDMAHPSYQRFKKGIGKILQKNTGIIYASSHEYNQQLNFSGGNYQVISGSLAKSEPLGKDEDLLFSSSACGFSKIEYLKDGSVRIRFYKIKKGVVYEQYSKTLFQSACNPKPEMGVPVNSFNSPCIEKDSRSAVAHPESVILPASTVYKAGFAKRLFFGTLYRKAWLQPVKVNYLDMDTSKGGLKAFATGGGRQTLSLKLKAGNGSEYVFRSIDKDFTRTLMPAKLKNTFLERILRDITATQHPYGSLAASKMLDKTEIFHAQPQLYILPDDPALGPYRGDYAGMIGMLEDRPADGYKGSDKVNQTVTMISKLYEDHDNRISTESFGRSRVFDMLIGDWGRHEDNYKWAAYKQNRGTLYYPIPRDRDQAFSRWNGIIPSMADGYYALPFVENFDDKLHNLKSLNYNARHIDRLLLTSLTREDWKKMSEYIVERITDNVIDSAMATLPPEVKPSAEEIAFKLKKRRTQLSERVDEYYKILAEKVDVVGSNKKEYFEAERLKNGNVKVKMWALADNGTAEGEPLFQREFVRGETEEICLYGLGGEDVFTIKGSGKKSILLRVIGGDGPDKVLDSTVNASSNKTYVYDTPKTFINKPNGFKDKTSDKFNINRYDRHDFKYNTFIPSGSLFYSRDDGFGLSLGERYTTYGFRKPEFKTRYEISLTATSNKNLFLEAKTDWAHVLGKWDAVFNGSIGRYYPRFQFFGLGNNTKKYEKLYQEDFYLLNPSGFTAGIFAERKFFKFAFFHLGPVLEQIELTSENTSLLGNSTNMSAPLLGGIEAQLNLDLRNKKSVASKGFRFSGKITPYHDLSGSSDFVVSEAFAEYYLDFKFLLPFVLAAEVGGSKVTGDKVPLNKYAFLGQKNHLRGYVRHRFTGDQSAYLNTEARMIIGKSKNEFIPFYFGLFGFKDYGKVWYKGKSGGWHSSEGGGFFIAPISTSLTLRCSLEHSPEERMLVNIGAGFYLDK